MKTPPQIKGSIISGNYKQFKTDPIKLLLDSSDKFGDIFMFKVLNKKIYFVNNPEYIDQVTKTNLKNYIKTPGTPIKMIAGEGIFTADGEEWLKRRKLYQPALNNTSIKSYTSAVTSNAEEMIADINERVQAEENVNISREMSKITISILSETLFSTKFKVGNSMWNDIAEILTWVGDRRLRHPFVVPATWPTKKNKRFHAAIKGLDDVIYNIIEEKKENNNNPDDLLSRFMNHSDDKYPKLNAKELRDEVVTIFLAGHETSANVLTWAFYNLSIEPEIQEKVFAEVSQLGDRPLQFEDLHSLIYTSQVLNETMRLYPPIWHFGRYNLEEDKIGDYVIPKGSSIRVSPMTIQRRTDYWENPEVFNPDRFDPSIKQTQNTFIPFGAGPRLCAGRNFAMMEMVLIIAMTIRKFKLTHVGDKAEMAPMLTLRPKKDVFVKAENRD